MPNHGPRPEISRVIAHIKGALLLPCIAPDSLYIRRFCTCDSLPVTTRSQTMQPVLAHRLLLFGIMTAKRRTFTKCMNHWKILFGRALSFRCFAFPGNRGRPVWCVHAAFWSGRPGLVRCAQCPRWCGHITFLFWRNIPQMNPRGLAIWFGVMIRWDKSDSAIPSWRLSGDRTAVFFSAMLDHCLRLFRERGRGLQVCAWRLLLSGLDIEKMKMVTKWERLYVQPDLSDIHWHRKEPIFTIYI